MACLAIAAMTTVLDLALLERKYDVFRGGFLQAHPIRGAGQITAFVLTLLLIEVLFAVMLAGIWGAIGRRLAASRALTAYHFLTVVGGISVAIIALRYQLLSYFSDFMSFAVLKNLGGGNLKEAIAFGVQEGRLFALILGMAGVLYAAGHGLIRARLRRRGGARPLAGSGRVYLGTSAGALAVLAVVILLVNRHEDFRFHLNRVTAYAYTQETLDTLTDVDRDGYGLFAWLPDPAPFDRTIYPGALDIPGDGIDQDGLLGDFAYTPKPRVTVTFPGRPLHLVVVVLESTRADVLEATLDGRPVTPVLRDLARAGAANPLFYSHTAFTSSSIKAMFSGSLSGLPVFGTSLFTTLKEHGYQVAVVSGQNESFGGMAETLRMREAAVHFFDATLAPSERVFPSTDPGSLTLSNARVLREFATVADQLDWTRPVFAYVNLQSAHFPYHHPGMPILLEGVKPIDRSAIGAGTRTALQRTYWNAIANADAGVGQVLAELRARGVLEQTVVVVCGDHGESLFDDGLLGHGHQLNDIQTRALFVSNRPGPAFAGLLGQADLSLELLRAVGARLETEGTGGALPADGSPREVFQVVGPIDRPGVIGTVNAERRRVLFNPRSREAYFDSLGQWVPLADVEDRHLAESARLRALILRWEEIRWEQHLSRTPR
ncbi:MAG: LTA synthase family protein [Candidatus Rokuibacteriota bacterium]